ncbi:hypothetical protein Gogos_021653 [Gossypium gossypioides]|uniref:Zinc knuckle CX2CX4HX4C domain-containing protein n=1 Tax=Gossypium gossypioides TaxID=34282 RepID=A0A7J9CX82_GOSGO|nr:hypothetical protein [Gossypium gossypioides]
MVVYARFRYEKLSLFCFIYGKLGHGESYCPVRLTIEPTKIVFGWDLSLRAVVRRRNMKVSRWLRAIDGSPYSEKNLAGVMYGNSRGSGRNSNPNLIPLGPDPIQVDGRLVKKQDGCIDNLTTNGLVQGE